MLPVGAYKSHGRLHHGSRQLVTPTGHGSCVQSRCWASAARAKAGQQCSSSSPCTSSSTSSSAGRRSNSSTCHAFVSSAAAGFVKDEADEEVDEDCDYVIPAAYKEAATAVANTMAAAEAAQQALLTSGQLAEAAANNQLLRSILQTYSTVQQLYHKAMLQHLQRHEQLAGSPAGLAYALLCEVLGQQPGKQPGGSVSSKELQLLQERVKQAAPLVASSPLAHLASTLIYTLDSSNLRLHFLKTIADICVMPDLMTCLAMGWTPPQVMKTRTSMESSFSASDLLRRAGSAVMDVMSGSVMNNRKPHLQQMLLRVCSPSDTPYPWDDSASEACLKPKYMKFSMQRCTIMAQVVDAAMDTLEAPADKEALATATVSVAACIDCFSSNPMKTCATQHSAGDIAAVLMDSLMYNAISSLMHHTAMRQLLGLQAPNDWEAVITVRVPAQYSDKLTPIFRRAFHQDLSAFCNGD